MLLEVGWFDRWLTARRIARFSDNNQSSIDTVQLFCFVCIILNGDSLFVWYWPNQHGKHAMLDMPLWSCQLQQHILADPVNSF